MIRQADQTHKKGFDHWFFQGSKRSVSDATVLEWVAVLEACGAEISVRKPATMP